MKVLWGCKVVLFSFFLANCSRVESQIKEVILWENNIPETITDANYQEELQIENGILLRAKKVTSPTLTIFTPEMPNGTAVLIIPGGGYQHVTVNKEGAKAAEWLNTLGITAFVLKYRLPSDRIMKDKSIGPLQDAQKAMRYIRGNVQSLQLKENKIGVLGFSAGGHLAATLANHYDKKVYNVENTIRAKPDFSVLIYPVISMKDTITHSGSKNNLLGTNPSEEKTKEFSLETQVTIATPKTFLVHAKDDTAVPIQNSLLYYAALQTQHVSAEMHSYKKGGHGFGLGVTDGNKLWTLACENWLRAHHLIDAKKK